MLPLIACSDAATSRAPAHQVVREAGAARLSGEQQRFASTRALIERPRALVADDPGGLLDSATGAAMIVLLHGIREGLGTTVVIGRRDHHAVELPDRVAS